MAGAFGDITPVQNTLLDVSLPYLAATKYQLGQNALATGQQDLTDRDTLRGLAGGLTSRDPNALGTAASLGSTGQGAVTALSTSDAQTAASKLAALQYTAGLPQWNGPASGGGAPAPGGAGGGASGGGDILDRLGVGESSNRPGVVNSQGYSGMFQFGTGRLKDLGLYQPAQGENPNGNQWKGTFNIPGFPQVQTYQQFLASPDAQRAAVHVHAADIDQNIAATPGADQLNRNGLVAVAHLGGVGGMQKFVQTGGQYNPADSNGTHLSDYYSRYSQAGLQQLANDHGHPAGPLPGYNPAQIAPGDAFAGPGMAGASVSSAVPVQVASNINARGMPQTANDASSAGGIPVPPIPPASGAPLQNNDDVTAVDSADGAQGLPAGARYSVGGGPIQVKPAGGSATGPAGMSSQQAVAEAQQELAGRQQGMDPAAANQQVIERARLLMQGASAPASSFAPSAASSTPPQAALLPARPSSRTDVPSPAGRPVNSLLASLPPSPVTGTPPQPNALLASLGLPPAAWPDAGSGATSRAGACACAPVRRAWNVVSGSIVQPCGGHVLAGTERIDAHPACGTSCCNGAAAGQSRRWSAVRHHGHRGLLHTGPSRRACLRSPARWFAHRAAAAWHAKAGDQGRRQPAGVHRPAYRPDGADRDDPRSQPDDVARHACGAAGLPVRATGWGADPIQRAA